MVEKPDRRQRRGAAEARSAFLNVIPAKTGIHLPAGTVRRHGSRLSPG